MRDAFNPAVGISMEHGVTFVHFIGKRDTQPFFACQCFCSKNANPPIRVDIPSDASHWPAAARYAVLPRAVDNVGASDLGVTTRRDDDNDKRLNRNASVPRKGRV